MILTIVLAALGAAAVNTLVVWCIIKYTLNGLGKKYSNISDMENGKTYFYIGVCNVKENEPTDK